MSSIVDFSRTTLCRRALLTTLLGSGILTSSLWAESSPLIESGSLWLDTSGRPINAHGGGLLWHEGVYYWYGEIKTGETTPASNANWGSSRVPMVGVSCYSSRDLIRWTDEGNVLPADGSSPELRSDRILERPKVIFNRITGQFVMWMHIDSPDYQEARTGVAASSSPRGPFRFLRALRPDAGVIPDDMPENLRHEFEVAHAAGRTADWGERHAEWRIWARDFAGGQMARDMALFVDDDGAAYQFYASEENTVLHVSRLTDDYLQHAGRYRRITFDSREAPAPFKWKGRYYLVSSGCTGWAPNPTQIHSAAAVLGPWTGHGSFFREASSAAEVSFHSQPTFVAPIFGGGLLFMADRWNQHNLEDSRYVWLPIDLSRDIPRVDWLPGWDIAKIMPASSRKSGSTKHKN